MPKWKRAASFLVSFLFSSFWQERKEHCEKIARNHAGKIDPHVHDATASAGGKDLNEFVRNPQKKTVEKNGIRFF